MCKAIILLVKASESRLTKEFLFTVLKVLVLLSQHFVHICTCKRIMEVKCFAFPFSPEGQSCPQEKNQEPQ